MRLVMRYANRLLNSVGLVVFESGVYEDGVFE